MPNVILVASATEILATEIEAGLSAFAHDVERIDAGRASLGELAAAFAGADAVVVVRPRSGAEIVAVGTAFGLGKRLVLLDAGPELAAVPGAVHAPSIDAAVTSVRALEPMPLSREQAGSSGDIDTPSWLRRLYPEGLSESDWTVEEQVRALASGGARFLVSAHRAGYFPLWPMDGVDLCGADLRRADFRELSFAGARLDGVDLSEGDLREASFRGASLVGAKLSRAHLRGADFREANLRSAVFHRAELVRARFSRADLQRADLSLADLSGADLSDADLRGASLKGACLAQIVAQGANIEGCFLEGILLSDADLRGARLSGARLSRANLTRANLSGALVDGADFKGAHLASAMGVAAPAGRSR
ncbi:pentapeptide repeat-containing protein [Sorangium sp. So ce124]|uniref:pentapeptide repeat-containing protein n=1 Tax=Sorangium sp. So ce124 TaxID=3133280 RepID=UPI003F63EB53